MGKSRPGVELLIDRQGITVCINVSLSQTLIESIGPDRVAHTLRSGSGKVEPIAAPEHGLVRQTKRDADSRRKIVLVSSNESADDAQSRLGGRHDPVIDHTGVEKWQGLIGGNDEAPLLSGCGVDEARVEVGQ